MASSIAAIWPWLVAVLLARGRGDLDALLLAGLLGALLHGDEERVGGVLGDQGDRDLVAVTAGAAAAASTSGEHQRSGAQRGQAGELADCASFRTCVKSLRNAARPAFRGG